MTFGHPSGWTAQMMNVTATQINTSKYIHVAQNDSPA